MRYAVIESGRVANIILASAEFAAEAGAIPAGSSVIGDEWDGHAFHSSASLPPPVPSVVTMRQARLALLGAGLLDTINAAILAMPGDAGAIARIEWEFASEVRRGQPLVRGLGAALDLDDAALDALFVAAAQL